MKPFSWGITALFLFSILFEPLRLALWRLGDEVGGVGGVGGLTNQFTPIHCAQNHSDGEFMMCTKPYYFRAGWMGLTPFAGIVLLICFLPLLAAAVASILGTSTRTYIKCKKVFGTERLLKNEVGELEVDNREAQDCNDNIVNTFYIAWACASCLWFMLPFAYYIDTPFYQKDVWHVILAVSLSSAFPLSWHLSFVTFPTASGPLFTLLLGLSPATLKKCHKRIAWGTCFWGFTHAVGELVYLTSQGLLNSFSLNSDNLTRNDSLLFIFGLATFMLLLSLLIHALSRFKPFVASIFRASHRGLAVMLLLVASAHWWPFAIFLMPAITCGATSYALRRFHIKDIKMISYALLSSNIGGLLGFALVWYSRQLWSLKNPENYYGFSAQMFPVLAIVLAYAFSWTSATVTFKMAVHYTEAESSTCV